VKSLNRKTRVTLKDIALKTGYTVNTVSHALKDKNDISEATKKKIQHEAKKMGYINNILAGSLRSGITKTIAIIIADISNPIFSIKVKEIDRVLRRYHYNTIIINTDEDSEIEYDGVLSAIGRKVDGIIICPTQKDKRIFNLMRMHNIPFVLLGRRFNKGKKMSSVIWDDENGGYLATNHLIELGKKRILFLNGPSYLSNSQDRHNGYIRALTEHGLQMDPQLLVSTDISGNTACETLREIIQSGVKFDALLAFSDFVAWEAISTLKEFGKDVPRDIPIVGFDDLQSHLKIPLPITSIGADKAAEAEAAVRILLNDIEGGVDNKVYCEVIDTMLVKRESA
jgi:LacI family transcriptional regulator